MPSPTLSRAERLKVVAQATKATAQLQKMLKLPTVDAEQVRAALAMGAQTEALSFEAGDTPRNQRKYKLWPWVMHQDLREVWDVLLETPDAVPAHLLEQAVEENCLPLVERLLARGWDPNRLPDLQDVEATPLMETAFLRGGDAMVDALVSAGADLAAYEAWMNQRTIPSREDNRAGWVVPSLLFCVSTPKQLTQVLALNPSFERTDRFGRSALACLLETHQHRNKDSAVFQALFQGLVEAGHPVVVHHRAGTPQAYTDVLLKRLTDSYRSNAAFEQAARWLIAHDPKSWEGQTPSDGKQAATWVRLGVRPDWNQVQTAWLSALRRQNLDATEAQAVVRTLFEAGVDFGASWGKQAQPLALHLAEQAARGDDESGDRVLPLLQAVLRLGLSDPAPVRKTLSYADDHQAIELAEDEGFWAHVQSVYLLRQMDAPKAATPARPRI